MIGPPGISSGCRTRGWDGMGLRIVARGMRLDDGDQGVSLDWLPFMLKPASREFSGHLLTSSTLLVISCAFTSPSICSNQFPCRPCPSQLGLVGQPFRSLWINTMLTSTAALLPLALVAGGSVNALPQRWGHGVVTTTTVVAVPAPSPVVPFQRRYPSRPLLAVQSRTKSR